MSYKMSINAEHVAYSIHDQDPEVSYEPVFTDREFDSIEALAISIREHLGHCELDSSTLDRDSWLQSITPGYDCVTGIRTFFNAFPVLTIPEWKELLFILFAWGLIDEWAFSITP